MLGRKKIHEHVPYRRRPFVEEKVIRVFDLQIDTAARTVQRAGQFIKLRPREYELLQLLAVQRGRVVSRATIWEKLYDEFDANTSNVVDVHIRHLRVSIDHGFTPPLILTRYGQGYLLRTEEHDG